MASFNEPVFNWTTFHVQSQFALIADISEKFLDAAQGFNAAHIQIAQRLMQESLDATRQMLTAQRPHEVTSAATGQAQPDLEKMHAYRQHLIDIAQAGQIDLATTADSAVPGSARTASTVAEEVARHADTATHAATLDQDDARAHAGAGAKVPGQKAARGKVAEGKAAAGKAAIKDTEVRGSTPRTSH